MTAHTPSARVLGHATTHEEWLELRRQGLGGSDAATLLGESKWTSPFELFMQKIGQAEGSAPNVYTKIGTLLEPAILGEVCPGATPGEQLGTLQSLERPHMLANVDGLDGDVLIEIKTTAEKSKRYWMAGPPDHYRAQVQHYLYVTGLGRCVVHCGFITGDRRTLLTLMQTGALLPQEVVEHMVEIESFELERDEAWLDYYLPQADAFWEKVEREAWDEEACPF